MRHLFSGLLVAAGMILMLTSGLCTLLVSVLGFTAVFQEPSIVFLPLLFGGIPFALGFGLYKWGRALARKPDDYNVF